MSVQRVAAAALAITVCSELGFGGAALAQTARRDAIAEWLRTADSSSSTQERSSKAGAADKALPPRPADPRDGDPQYEQAKALMVAIDGILKDAADTRAGASKLPSRDEYILPPFWKEMREDRNGKVRTLLDAALSIVTNAPIVETQNKIEGFRKNIRDIEDENTKLREKQIVAPKEATLAGILNDTVGSIQTGIDENNKRIAINQTNIKTAKSEIATALRASGVELEPGQIDLLLDSVLSGDLVRLVAIFNSAKLIDTQLARLIGASNENMEAARRYFAMHAALFAMLVQAQDATISKIDTQYVPKLDAIIADIAAAKGKTAELLKGDNRPDQKRALDANGESQKLADAAAASYRRYLQQQRDQIAKARSKAVHDLRIADNTYETVEASVQLRNLMRESSASFEAIQKLEAPSLEQIFKNDELRREFENLTRKLDAPAS